MSKGQINMPKVEALNPRNLPKQRGKGLKGKYTNQLNKLNLSKRTDFGKIIEKQRQNSLRAQNKSMQSSDSYLTSK